METVLYGRGGGTTRISVLGASTCVTQSCTNPRLASLPAANPRWARKPSSEPIRMSLQPQTHPYWQECVVFSQTLDFDSMKMEREIAEIRQLIDEPEIADEDTDIEHRHPLLFF